jgi:hypothetical protein
MIRSDLLVEGFFKRAEGDPFAVFPLLFALRRGNAHFKDVIARGVDLDPASLPYDEAVLRLIREAIEAGRQSISHLPATNVSYPLSRAISDFLPAGSAPAPRQTSPDATKRAFLPRGSVRVGLTISATIRPLSMCGK